MALSSTEAECIWLKQLLHDIGVDLDYQVPIGCDNGSTIKLAENPIFHARTKHIEIHHHFVREKVLEIILQKVGTNDQVADVQTKALPRVKFEKLCSNLGIIDKQSALRGVLKISAVVFLF